MGDDVPEYLHNTLVGISNSRGPSSTPPFPTGEFIDWRLELAAENWEALGNSLSTLINAPVPAIEKMRNNNSGAAIEAAYEFWKRRPYEFGSIMAEQCFNLSALLRTVASIIETYRQHFVNLLQKLHEALESTNWTFWKTKDDRYEETNAHLRHSFEEAEKLIKMTDPGFRSVNDAWQKIEVEALDGGQTAPSGPTGRRFEGSISAI